MKINVLSLFDGISVAKLALDNLKIDCNYYSSEIDESCLEITRLKHPNNIELGDVTQIDFTKLPKIDLLIGGSPCQDLSINKHKRTGLKGSKSSLFYYYLNALNILKPKYFLLENVASMRVSDRDIITKALNVNPILINSNLLTAQNRKRLYWSNINNITQPANANIFLNTIVDVNEVSLTETRTDKAKKIRSENMKNKGKDYSPRRAKELKERTDNKSNCITAGTSKEFLIKNKTTGETRYLTPEECEQLQGLPINYTSNIAKTKRYKAIGNSFTLPVIQHILSFL